MSKKPEWKKPVFLEPEQLQTEQLGSTFNSATSAIHPQEFDPQQLQPIDETSPTVKTKKKRKTWRRWLAIGVSGLLGAVIGSEVYRFISWGFELHTIVGIGFSLLTTAVFLSIALWVADSLRGLRQLTKTEALHQQAKQLIKSQQHGNAQTFLRKLDKHTVNTPMNSSFKEAIRQVDSAYNDSEIIQFISNHTLTEQDAAARRCIKEHSVQSGLMVALSPYATFDMLLVGWRNLKMLRAIAEIYGIAPGAATQWKLLSQVLHNIAFSGVSELLIDMGTQTLGTSLTGQVSARAAQGTGAGLFTLRTGSHAIELCRPLPLSDSSRHALGKINRHIIESVVARATGVSQDSANGKGTPNS